jgi:imidazole glycerol-phosphate synthase subunit HisH
MIAIIDYGMGNIHSVQKALALYGAKTIVSNRPEEIKKADKAVLPGVGAFDDAVLELEKQGLIPAIKAFVKDKKPFFGICLGMQLFFESSQEAVKKKGMGILKGQVKKFSESKSLKVPHMGWNQLKKSSECPLLKGVPNNSFVYFCHSYFPEPDDLSVVAAKTLYGSDFTSFVWKDNLFGAQFHPEKSQAVGLKILENFVRL